MAKGDTLTLRRTRRPDNPFDARLEVRLYSTEKAKLLGEAEKRGMTGSDLIRSQLGDLIAAPPPEPPAPAPPIDLAEAIAERTGVSWGHAALKIKLGRVSVKGEPCTDKQIRPELLPTVEVDGEPLGPEIID